MLWNRRANLCIGSRCKNPILLRDVESTLLLLTSSSLEIVGLMQGSCHFVREDCITPSPPKKQQLANVHHRALITQWIGLIVLVLHNHNCSVAHPFCYHFGSHLPGWGASCWFVGPGHYYWAASLPPPSLIRARRRRLRRGHPWGRRSTPPKLTT